MSLRSCLVRLSVTVISVLLITAAPAGASVTVSPTEAQRGMPTELTFRVTNESQSATVTAFALTFPTEANIAFTVESEGWNFTTDERSVRWTANPDAVIPINQSKTFRVQVQSMPELDSLSIPVTQTYSDGIVNQYDGQQGIAPVVGLTVAMPTTTIPDEIDQRLQALEDAQPQNDDDGGWGFLTFVLAVIALVKIYRLKRRLRAQQLRA